MAFKIYLSLISISVIANKTNRTDLRDGPSSIMLSQFIEQTMELKSE